MFPSNSVDALLMQMGDVSPYQKPVFKPRFGHNIANAERQRAYAERGEYKAGQNSGISGRCQCCGRG